ncbi:MAG: acetyl/propionyl/methylcrotonyl-CoA carboxylase subunit alpha [Alphaproteobacteria bacterium]
MITSILIANRGEIACRVISTARQMGIRTIAVYSDADAGSLHVEQADQAVRLGPAPATDSYLMIDKVIAAAKASGADAIHPGYGFLSENADFARACAENDIIFIGPPASAIDSMGDKAEAKKIMEAAGVPLLPGWHGEPGVTPDQLREEAEKIGTPLLIKAVAGGGGKGMRIVRDLAEFSDALAGAQREAAKSFGNDHVLLERYVEAPRHVEVQVLADSHGTVRHLLTRDCSVQRRHQKVLEEAPAPDLKQETLDILHKAAVDAAKAVDYVGAGTVEFLVDAAGGVYFMEMNTRLQVEHPVTELITGEDLVRRQIEVAQGEQMEGDEPEARAQCHAIEARLYAEDPDQDFLPQTGKLHVFGLPWSTMGRAEEGMRIDTGFRHGDEVSRFYDPMLAKVIVWGPDRAAAIRQLTRAMEMVQVAGPATNRDWVLAALDHEEFRRTAPDTGFAERHEQALKRAAPATADRAMAAMAALSRQVVGHGSGDPWSEADSFRINLPAQMAVHLRGSGMDGEVVARRDGADWLLDLPGEVEALRVAHWQREAETGRCSAEVDGVPVAVSAFITDDKITLITRRTTWSFDIVDDLAEAERGADSGGGLTAPIPATIAAVLVTKGQSVEAGDKLMVLEAMKMELSITAPRAGVIEDLPYAEGDRVEEGTMLVHLSDTAAEAA